MVNGCTILLIEFFYSIVGIFFTSSSSPRNGKYEKREKWNEEKNWMNERFFFFFIFSFLFFFPLRPQRGGGRVFSCQSTFRALSVQFQSTFRAYGTVISLNLIHLLNSSRSNGFGSGTSSFGAVSVQLFHRRLLKIALIGLNSYLIHSHLVLWSSSQCPQQSSFFQMWFKWFKFN